MLLLHELHLLAGFWRLGNQTIVSIKLPLEINGHLLSILCRAHLKSLLGLLRQLVCRLTQLILLALLLEHHELLLLLEEGLELLLVELVEEFFA